MENGGRSDGFAKTERAVSSEHQAVQVTARSNRDTKRLGGTLLRQGDELGRFELGECLGEGGMGAVVAAYDSTLDRKVAIKVLRPSAVLDVADDEARTRLLREARAMARVKHPNVITVHEVGEDRGQVFIAMEYVEGGTLREWMADGPHRWREIIEMFLPIARGLTAAHEVNLVHRDVKPENVLLTTGKSPIVTDFGLASASAAVVRGASTLEDHHALNVTLTQSGAVMGTPAYMSPEQHEGKEADARADQFAFCVMLWEALYGERPFAGQTFVEVRDNVVTGEISLPSAGDVGVPAALDRALQKGLSPDPAARFASMSDLADAIEAVVARRGNLAPNLIAPPEKPEPNRRPIYLAIAGGAAILISVVIAGFLFAGSDDDKRSDLCRGFEERMTGVWDPETKGLISEAFANADASGRAFSRLEPVLDRYAGRWISLRRASCEATLVRGVQSSEVYDRQIACFDRLLGGLRMATSRLEAVDKESIDKAVDGALTLPSVDRCAAGLR